MSFVGSVIGAAERLPLPDAATGLGIATLVGRTATRLAKTPDIDAVFARDMAEHAIAEHADAANKQHYELPAEFFVHVLGPNRKYSCCLFANDQVRLADAETAALDATIENAGLANGQDILDLGCGWGSLSLLMAERFPGARITAVSNSRPQRQFIMGRARALGLANLRVITADMNGFATQDRFDRIVSVEMFEHMSNWTELLGHVRQWLQPDGRLFIHIFTHKTTPYRFDLRNDADWIGQHFFSGGIMPSQGLIRQFPQLFTVEQEWRWSGTHYRQTALAWLANFDARIAEIDPILTEVYGADAALWRRRWRLFFLATAGLFGHAEGEVWGVSHYRLRPAAP